MPSGRRASSACGRETDEGAGDVDGGHLCASLRDQPGVVPFAATEIE